MAGAHEDDFLDAESGGAASQRADIRLLRDEQARKSPSSSAQRYTRPQASTTFPMLCMIRYIGGRRGPAPSEGASAQAAARSAVLSIRHCVTSAEVSMDVEMLPAGGGTADVLHARVLTHVVSKACLPRAHASLGIRLSGA